MLKDKSEINENLRILNSEIILLNEAKIWDFSFPIRFLSSYVHSIF